MNRLAVMNEINVGRLYYFKYTSLGGRKRRKRNTVRWKRRPPGNTDKLVPVRLFRLRLALCLYPCRSVCVDGD